MTNKRTRLIEGRKNECENDVRMKIIHEKRVKWKKNHKTGKINVENNERKKRKKIILKGKTEGKKHELEKEDWKDKKKKRVD